MNFRSFSFPRKDTSFFLGCSNAISVTSHLVHPAHPTAHPAHNALHHVCVDLASRHATEPRASRAYAFAHPRRHARRVRRGTGLRRSTSFEFVHHSHCDYLRRRGDSRARHLNRHNRHIDAAPGPSRRGARRAASLRRRTFAFYAVHVRNGVVRGTELTRRHRRPCPGEEFGCNRHQRNLRRP